MVVHPRATLVRVIVAREGSLLELLPWMVVVALALEPVRSGQAALLMRTSLVDGLMLLLSQISTRLTPALIGAFSAAASLYVAERLAKPAAEQHGFDAALDAAGYTLVPYLLLASAGRIASSAGLDLWWLPHHPLHGSLSDRAVEAAVGYGWSIALLALASYLFWTERPRRE